MSCRHKYDSRPSKGTGVTVGEGLFGNGYRKYNGQKFYSLLTKGMGVGMPMVFIGTAKGYNTPTLASKSNLNFLSMPRVPAFVGLAPR
jgi:hypothetical protein